MKYQCNSCLKHDCQVNIEGDCLKNLSGPELEVRVNRCSIVKAIHFCKKTQKGYAHLHFETFEDSSKFFDTYSVSMNVLCPLLPIQVKPASTRGEAVKYKTIAENTSGEDAPRRKVLCRCEPLAAEPASTPTPTPTELVLGEDEPETTWQSCLKRSIEVLESDIKEKEQEVLEMKKKLNY